MKKARPVTCPLFETDAFASRVGLVCVVVLVAACSSSKREAGVGAGGSAAGLGNTGGVPSGGGGTDVSGSGGALIAGAAGSGGTPAVAGNGGTQGNAGLAGLGGSESIGGASGSGGAPGGGAAGVGTAGAAAAGTGNGGSAGDGGSGGSAGVGCDWPNPDGRIVLFDGTSLSGWQRSMTGGAAHWRLVGDGSMEVVPENPSSNLETTTKFEDLCLHLEYRTPMYPENVTGQQRGNSGIYFKRSFEMQVLDSFGQPPAIDGCGAVYGISPPLAVACNAELVWNTYEIEFRASRWNASGDQTENAVFVSATLNGVLVQEDVELDVPSTTAGLPDAPGPQALMLQDHGNTVRFRNIWAKVPRY